MKRRLSPAGLICLLAAALAGCGQKGPLYLPDEARDVVTRPGLPAPEAAPPEETTPDEDKDENGKSPR